MKAKKKPLAEMTLADLGVTPVVAIKLHRMSPPPVRQGGKKVASIDELVKALSQEAKVI
jgi:electron transfer flavoprotein beta subunit